MRVLILGGTGEASALAAAGAARGDLEVISSLAGRTRAPALPPGEVRVGGFGGAAGLERFLNERAIDRVIDASHPFAARLAGHAATACRAAGVPRLRLLRRPWQRQAGDRWHEVADLAEAAARLPELGQRAFLTVGRKDLSAFAGVRGVLLLIRTIEPPADPLPAEAEWLQVRGPFTLESELELLRTRRIDVLVAKASGGEATYAKLAAARRLGLPVLMVRRPPPPPGPLAATVAEALAWLDAPAQPCRSVQPEHQP
jgi:precorrin-6A/cobalt-precorrin-6A reductase